LASFVWLPPWHALAVSAMALLACVGVGAMVTVDRMDSRLAEINRVESALSGLVKKLDASRKEHPPGTVGGYRGELYSKAVKRFDPTMWTHHTEWHWAREVDGKWLDYWPSRDKWQYDKGGVRHGDPRDWLIQRGEKP